MAGEILEKTYAIISRHIKISKDELADVLEGKKETEWKDLAVTIKEFLEAKEEINEIIKREEIDNRDELVSRLDKALEAYLKGLVTIVKQNMTDIAIEEAEFLQSIVKFSDERLAKGEYFFKKIWDALGNFGDKETSLSILQKIVEGAEKEAKE